jgi:hypothetical protein
MKDIMIDLDPSSVNYGDILIENKTAKLCTGVDYIVQRLRANLKLIYGEWFKDSIKGIKYFESILIKNPNMSVITSIFKSAITSSFGIVSLDKFEMDFNPSGRSLTIYADVTSTEGEASISETLP